MLPEPGTTAPTTGTRSAVGELRRSGRRVSATRLRVLEALHAADHPVSAATIASGLGGSLPCSDDASVYRTLDLLVELELVQRLCPAGGPALYATAEDGELDYLVCERCGRITAVDPRVLEPVRGAITRTFGWRVRFSRVPLVGLCPDCAQLTA